MIRLFENAQQSTAYAAYRPDYPVAVVEEIIKYAKNKHGTNEKLGTMIDIGCGTGQSTKIFHKYVTKIIGIDSSESQIHQAKVHKAEDNITYLIGSGEQIPIGDNSVDLICAASSIHYVDFDKFFSECRRVLKPNGSVALYTYHGGGKVSKPGEEYDAEANALVNNLWFRFKWSERHRYVNDGFAEIFHLIPTKDKCRIDDHRIEKYMSLQEYLGYVHSWSGYQTHLRERSKNDKEDIPNDFANKLKVLWKMEEFSNDQVSLRVIWDVFIVLSGRPQKL